MAIGQAARVKKAALVLCGLLGLVAACASTPKQRDMFCAPSRHMPGDGVPTYMECWDERSHCRPNAHVAKQCDHARPVKPYGFTEERQFSDASWHRYQRWFADEAECKKAHAETPNGTRGRRSCAPR